MTLTEEQIIQGFDSVMGMPPRTADVQVVQMMGGTIEVLADYIWDHWLGEPETPSVDDIEAQIEGVVS